MRAYNRFETDQEIECSVDEATNIVRLYNLSCGGCMIESDSPDIDSGHDIKVRFGTKLVLPGTVVWRIGKNAGIKFRAPLHQRLVQQLGYIPSEDFDRDDPRDRFGLPISD